MHPRVLRRPYVTTMPDAGVDLRDVQIAARHAHPRTTMRYDRARTNLDRPLPVGTTVRPRSAFEHTIVGWDGVVRHSAVLDPATFRSVFIAVKETSDTAWIALPDTPYPSDPKVLDHTTSNLTRPETASRGRTVVPRQLPAAPAQFRRPPRRTAPAGHRAERPGSGGHGTYLRQPDANHMMINTTPRIEVSTACTQLAQRPGPRIENVQ
jgi:hypothetical protein